MAKRDFRPTAGKTPAPTIPTLEAFDGNRRAFLARLGAALGIGALGSALSACGDRRVNTGDGSVTPEPPAPGGMMMPPSELDAQQPMDAGAPDQDWPMGGDPPAPDARADVEPDWGLQGKNAEPDARVDQGPDWGMDGDAPAPDARVDSDPDWGMGGVAPAPDARSDP